MKRLAMFIAAIALSGCAHNYVETYEPIIDTDGVSPVSYQTDLGACRSFAVREDPAAKAAQGAIAGALAGALLGAAVGGAYGRAGLGARTGAGEGAAIGLIGGAAGGVAAQETIVKRCMARRGYNVLY